jgi:hypothetical protein
VNSANLTTSGDLMIGFYDGQTVGAGVTGVSVSVTSNGRAVLPTTSFTSGSAAAAYFTDHPIDLGAIAANTVLDLIVNLSVTTDAANSGFYGEFILGDPAHAQAALPLGSCDGRPADQVRDALVLDPQ